MAQGYGIDREAMDELYRSTLIGRLMAMDPNGCYADEDCDSEGQPRVTVDEAIATLRMIMAITTQR